MSYPCTVVLQVDQRVSVIFFTCIVQGRGALGVGRGGGGEGGAGIVVVCSKLS